MDTETTCYRHPKHPARIVCQRCERPICPNCMVQGSVGFHCPECVKAAPQPKLKARRVQPNQATSMVLAAISGIVWLAILVTGMDSSPLLDVLAITPEGSCNVGDGRILLVNQEACADSPYTWVPGVATGAVWQVITSAFTHIQFMHIMFNMLALFVLGPQVESVLGRARFLAIYFFSAVTASAMVMAFTEPFRSTLGASGSIFGLMGAFLVIAWRQKADMRGILMWLGINAAITFLVPGVSWQGHLGGLLGGVAMTALMMSVWRRPQRKQEWWLVGLLFVLAAAAIAALALLRF